MTKETTSKPVAVLISDIHYNIQTLEVADNALRMAVNKANDLNVALIIAGDLHDTKANIRGECVKAIMDTLKDCYVSPLVLRGNHDSIHEKSTEHSLEFLQSIATLVPRPQSFDIVLNDDSEYPIYAIPYHNSADELRNYLKMIKRGSTLIMHQGIIGSEAGHYIQDKSAITKEDVASFRVISGHYHRRQTIQLPDNGTFDYIGNPYTLGFGEANDPEKGFQVLYNDGSLEFVPTNLRKHVVYNINLNDPGEPTKQHKENDIVWVKVTGSSDDLARVTKEHLKATLDLPTSFRLDLIPTETNTSEIEMSNDTPQDQILDSLIESLQNVDEDRKARLKNLWKQLT